MTSLKNKLRSNKNEPFLLSFARYNPFLVVCWIVCVFFLILYSINKNSTYRFMGLTEAYQYRVQFENPVILDKILVKSGQEVKKGELILELSSSKLTHELAKVNMELYQNFSEYKLYNKKATDVESTLKSIKEKKEKTILELKLLSLADIRSIFENQMTQLRVKAPFDGYIGSLAFVLGETVPSFNPVAFVSEKKAKIVRSYILEDDPSAENLSVGLSVIIRSENGAHGGQGKIFQIGTEVKELPARFQKTGYDTAYGREILVKISDETRFISGERVVVQVEK